MPKQGFRLLADRRFGPFFWTQALGAFNDNVFRFALMLSLTFTAAERLSADINILMNLASGLFILPFFLFSGIAGQLADKYEKAGVIRVIKRLELVIMLVALVAFSLQLWWLLLFLVFAMGMQSALFGPVKYAILPQQLDADELVTGNAWVGMGTFVAILSGTLTGGLLATWAASAPWILGLSGVIFALLGVLASEKVPPALAGNPGLRLNWNLYSQTRLILTEAAAPSGVMLAILAISWFWFIGSGYLTQFPNFTRSVLGSDAGVGTLLLAVFSLGVGGGALLCGYWSQGKIKLGLVPLGAIGMAVFSFALYSQALAFPDPAPSGLRNISQFWNLGGAGLALVLALAGMSGGLFIVPLYTWVQKQTPVAVRAQVIAALNVLNALAMVLSALLGIVFLGLLGLSLPLLFLFYAVTALLITGLVVRLASKN